MNKLLYVLALTLALLPAPVIARDTLRILTWDGYITAADLSNVNQLLRNSGYDIEATIIEPYAESAEQMFNLMRQKKVDISFLTLFFIKGNRYGFGVGKCG